MEGMSLARPKIVAVVGPTAAGKTALSLELAERFGAEIVNADSRQVYRHLDIGSAKPTGEQQKRVRHHLIDVAEPNEPFDCARYRQLALAAIDEILGRGRRVLLVGGTGLYVKVLLRGVFTGPPRNAGLRRNLEEEEAAVPGSLHMRLAKVDPSAAARLHANDRMRVIRALEVLALTGKPISAWQAEHRFEERPFATRLLGITLPREQLYGAINARCDAMLTGGLVEEVQRLYAAGVEPIATALQSPGYREVGEYLRGQCTLAEARQRMAQATRRLAKRQLTWFRGDPEVLWCPANSEALASQLESWW